MNIPFEGRITERDLFSIYTFALRGRRWRQYFFAASAVLFLIVMILSFVKDTFAPALMMFILVIVFGAGLTRSDPAQIARASYRSSPEMRGLFSGTISEDLISVRTANTATDFKWTAFRKVDRSSDLVLLYVNEASFNFFLRSFFASDSDWQSFQALIDQKIQDQTLILRSTKPDLRSRRSISMIGLIILAVLFFLAWGLMLIVQPVK